MVGRKRNLLLASALVLSGISFSSGTLQAADWAPKDPPSQYSPTAGPNAVKRRDFITDVCTTTSQLDCVESIGAFLNGAWVDGVPTTTVTSYDRIWTIPGLVNLDGQNRVAVMHQINYTGNLFLTTEIRSARDYGDRDEIGVQRDVKFRATIRTSWVLPTHVAGPLTDAKLTVTKLPISGASKVTMEGTPTVGMVVLDESALTSETGKGSYETRQFSMGVSDGRFYPIKKECIEKPSIMTADNGYGFALPKFEKGNLDLKVSSPHFRSDGVTVHYGIYEANIPLETAKCLWGDSISAASEFKVEVVETSGSTKTATRSVTVTSDAVSIKATGFTYSSPTIRVSYVAPTVATSTTSSQAPSNSSSIVTTKAPAKPTGLAVSASKRALSVSFKRVTNVSYAVVATKGTTKKTLRCTSTKTQVKCQLSNAAIGTWKVTVTPKSAGQSGASASKSVKIFR